MNDLELSIINSIAQNHLDLKRAISKLKVVSRECTDVGSYTHFECSESIPSLGNKIIGLEGLIRHPSVPNGMIAELSCKNGKPSLLEIVTFGSEKWGGNPKGFKIENSI